MMWLIFFGWVVREINKYSYIKYKLALKLCMWVSVCVKQIVVRLPQYLQLRTLKGCLVAMWQQSLNEGFLLPLIWWTGLLWGGAGVVAEEDKRRWQYVYPYHRDFICGTKCCCCCNLLPQTLSPNIGFVTCSLFLWGNRDISSRNIRRGFKFPGMEVYIPETVK